MRNGIRDRLIAAIPAIGGRVLDRHEAEGTATEPYLVLAQGMEIEEETWNGYRRTYKIWPYQTKEAGFAAVDELAGAIIDALHEQRLTDPATQETFTCRYAGAIGTERLDARRNAITHGLRFHVEALRTEDVGQADEWLEALGAWTTTLLGSAWQVCLESWPLGYKRPAVLWRIASTETTSANASSYVTVKRFTGHVLANGILLESATAARLSEQLQAEGKLVLDAADRRYLTVRDSSAEMQPDALTEGQLRLVLSRRILRPMARQTLMEEVAIKPLLL